MMPGTQNRRLGLSLLELVLVLFVLVILAAMVVPMVGKNMEDAQLQTTMTNLVQLRNVILNVYRADMNKELPRPGSMGLGVGQVNHPQLRYLFVNPKTETATVDYDPVYRLGWRGPYLLQTSGQYRLDVAQGFTTTYGEVDLSKYGPDPTILDGWQRPIVIVPDPTPGKSWQLASAGQDGTLGTGDDVYLSLY